MADESAIQLISADRVSLGQRVAIMNAAYADYFVPTRVSQEQMEMMDRCFDISPRHSVVARTRWECVGMALLAVRQERAWISGVGVVPAWRRKSVARSMMGWLLSEARAQGANQVILEVIDANRPARHLYESLGFREVRELLTWQRPSSADALPIPLERLSSADPQALLEHFEAWHTASPCWQRELVSLRRMAGPLRGYRLDYKDELAAYCLIGGSDDAVAIVDVGINPDTGLLMPGRLLLQALSASHWGRSMSIMNVPADDPLSRILAALRFRVTIRQVEMAMDL